MHFLGQTPHLVELIGNKATFTLSELANQEQSGIKNEMANAYLDTYYDIVIVNIAVPVQVCI